MIPGSTFFKKRPVFERSLVCLSGRSACRLFEQENGEKSLKLNFTPNQCSLGWPEQELGYGSLRQTESSTDTGEERKLVSGF